ncbi:transmembrane amino acid transporter, partial [Hamiltosporidium magnivora]
MKRVLGSAYFNLLKTILGCGILVYPSLYKNYGIIPTTVLTLISGFFSLSGLFLYVLTNKIINKKSTMSTISRYSIPSLRYVVDVVVILKCFFVTVSYMIFLKEIIPYGFGKLGFEYFVERKELGLLICLLISLPLNLLRKIDGLKFTSVFGIGSVIFILLTSFYRLIRSNSDKKIYYFTDNFSYYKSLGEFVFGFTCHQNIFTIQNEMEGVKIWELNCVMFMAIFTASLIYILFGIINYKIFGELIEGNFLNILDDDKLKIVTVVIYGIMILISIPLQ